MMASYGVYATASGRLDVHEPSPARALGCLWAAICPEPTFNGSLCFRLKTFTSNGHEIGHTIFTSSFLPVRGAGAGGNET
jgi:hypothetical protein